MSRAKHFCVTTLVAVIALACSSDDQDENSPASACTPGRSEICVGVAACEGYQVCKADGSGYDACQCQGNAVGSSGGAKATSTSTGRGGAVVTASGGTGNRFSQGGSVAFSSGGSTSTGAMGGNQVIPGTANSVGSAGANSTSSGGAPIAGATSGATTSGGGISLGGATGSGVCAPADMTGYAYPTYVPARRLGGSCTDADVQNYITSCYQKGLCTDFQGSGAKAACGACLAPSGMHDAAYGPLIRFGEARTALDQTNMAGCIELLGEANCAKKMMVSTLCEYGACSDNCPLVPDAASYNALSSCMVNARSTSCTAAQAAAVCITDSAHVAACTGSGFEGQFLALGRVFCVQSN